MKGTWDDHWSGKFARAEGQLSLKVKVLATLLCRTLCDPMGCSLPSSSVHGILQARTLEQGVISYSRGSFQPRD